MRFSIGWLMIVVAILAGFFAAFGAVHGGMLAGLFVLLLSPVSFVRRERRLVVATWIMALYPIYCCLSLYAIYLASWISLGRAPRPFLDDPKSIGPWVDWFDEACNFVCSGVLVALLVSVILSAFLVVQTPRVDHEAIVRREYFQEMKPLSTRFASPFLLILLRLDYRPLMIPLV